MRSKRTRILLGATAVSLVLGVQACSSSDKSGTSGTSGTSKSSGSASSSGSAKSALPAAIKSKGYIDVGSFFNYPPYTVPDGSGVKGIEPDLINAVAKQLGVQARFHNLAFEAMIPSVLNGRSDMLIGPLSDNTDRRKQVSFVDTLKVALRILVAAGNPKHINPDDLCGTTAGESAGSQQLQLLQTLATQCAAAGKPKLKVLTFTDPAESFLAVTSGRTDYTVQDPALAKYTADQNKKFEELDQSIKGDEAIPEGWVVAKDNTQLAEAIVAAVKQLMADGTWQKIMEDAGLSDLAIEPPTINLKPATGS